MKKMKYLAALLAAVTAVLPISTAALTVCALPQQTVLKADAAGTVKLSGDTLTLTLDTLSRLLILDGYTGNDYMLPLIGREGNYHRLEISLYSDCLRRNMALRASRHRSLSDTFNSKHDNN